MYYKEVSQEISVSEDTRWMIAYGCMPVGIGIGTIVDQKNRWRGAALGLIIGAISGNVLLRVL